MHKKSASKSLKSGTDLTEVVVRYMSDEDASRVYSAFLLAAEAHDGVVRKSGEFYIFHPIEVAYTLAEFHMDADTICAALLHDVIEDTNYTKADISAEFGSVVADLVDGVTKLAGSEFDSRQEMAAASFHKMMIAMTQDYRVVLIKLADRLHNVKTLGVRKPEAKRRIANETLDIHVPLARRMGMNALRKDLQVIAFKHLYPWRSRLLQKSIDCYTKENAEKHHEISKIIIQKLFKEGLKPQVFHWNKNIYRLFQRLKNKKGRKHLDKKNEALEIRVLVNSTAECYLTLGYIHQLFQPKLDSFKDFIATPKGYGFQALQTALVTPDRQLVRVQIQSHEMYYIAQYGITAHFRYPELLNYSDKSQTYLSRWLKQVEDIQKATGNDAEFMEDMKADLFLNEIYLLTPKGETKVLPKGATPVDFAYAIHTEVGDKCVSALIDGEPCRLSTPIPNGATVAITTDPDATPHSLWLSFAITGKARSSIRSWVNKRKAHEFVSLGRQIIERTLKKYDFIFEDIDPDNLQQTLEVLGLKDQNAMFSSIARGNQSARIVAKRLLNDESLITIGEKDEEQIVLIKGTEGLVVNLQTCCYPIPNDPIVAKLDEFNGLEVHRNNCPALLKATRHNKTYEEDMVSISWVDDTSVESHFLAPLDISVRNQVGVLSKITNLLENMRVNIEDINISGDSDVKDMYFLLQVHGEKHLQEISESLNNQSHIIDVSRPFTQSKY